MELTPHDLDSSNGTKLGEEEAEDLLCNIGRKVCLLIRSGSRAIWKTYYEEIGRLHT